jgi:ribosome-binding protein aMBF1 (putative translation factor)
MGSDKAHPIKVARLRLGLRQVDLAEKLGVNRRAVQTWEAWQSIPDKERMPALRKTLGLSELDEWRCTHRPAGRSVAKKPDRRKPIW